MARSDYIYIVTLESSSLPIAAFTVKHEMATWLRTQPDKGGIRVWRYRDRWRIEYPNEVDMTETI